MFSNTCRAVIMTKRNRLLSAIGLAMKNTVPSEIESGEVPGPSILKVVWNSSVLNSVSWARNAGPANASRTTAHKTFDRVMVVAADYTFRPVALSETSQQCADKNGTAPVRKCESRRHQTTSV